MASRAVVVWGRAVVNVFDSLACGGTRCHVRGTEATVRDVGNLSCVGRPPLVVSVEVWPLQHVGPLVTCTRFLFALLAMAELAFDERLRKVWSPNFCAFSCAEGSRRCRIFLVA